MEFEKSTRKTHLSSSFLSTTFAMSTTRRPTKFWATHTAWSVRTEIIHSSSFTSTAADSQKCVLQDFEAMTPNILARTIETVEGGGLVILLLKGMSSLKQLYTMSMDVHSRYRTEAHDDVVARFNERFILSLGSCESCLVIDDELNVLPISGGKGVKPMPVPDKDEPATPAQEELQKIKESLIDTQPVGSLIQLARTGDQAKSLLTFVDAIAEKTLRNTVTLTAARGRGKSAAMGLAIAAAVAHGYSNIFITSPSPENLKTLFEFVFKGFDALDYKDHADYSIIQSTNPDFNKAIVRVNIHRNHRQTIQYFRPQDSHILGQAELVVIDEAAAIPLPLVRKLMGPYLVFMASTISGYEGTGRSLSLKLIKQLREQSRSGAGASGEGAVEVDRTSGKAAKDTGFQGGRSLKEITLSEPIRYAQGDAVEKWLNTLLCLDATLPRSKLSTQGCPVCIPPRLPRLTPCSPYHRSCKQPPNVLNRIPLSVSCSMSTETHSFRFTLYQRSSCSRWSHSTLPVIIRTRPTTCSS